MNNLLNLSSLFLFEIPGKIIFGNGAIKKIGEEVASTFEGKKVVMITDKGVIGAGLTEEATTSLKEKGFEVTVFDKVVSDPFISTVLRGVEYTRREKADIVFGIGGGSSLDVAKAISILVPYKGHIQDCLGLNRVKRRGLPKVLVPTTAGTGSEVSAGCILTDDKTGKKITSFSPYFLSDLSIIDPTLTLSLPQNVTRDTGMDAFSHALEAFLCARANPLSDLFAERAIECISSNIRKAYAYTNGTHNLEARYWMCLGASFGILAMRASAGGMIHATSYPPATKYHLTHGMSISIMMPYVMEYNLIGNPEKYATVASTMGEKVGHLSTMDGARAAVQAVRKLLLDLEFPTNLKEIGAKRKDLPKFAKVAMSYTRNVANNPRNLTERDVLRIYESAWKGESGSSFGSLN
jgi:alcohol dehydrogenase class IV